MRKTILTFVILSCTSLANAQDINPFESIGKKGKILTLSNGKYTEVHINDSLQRIGSVIVNMNTSTIYELLDIDTLYSEATLDPTVISRWYSVDPLAGKFPNMSPYASFNNNPIYFVDPDGRENIPALEWARNNMANKGIPFSIWFGGESGWTYKIGTVPTATVCYESCFMSYLNSGDPILSHLQSTGFTNKSNAFKGRSTPTGGMNWFKQGDGTDRSFVTDISKGELGDIVFMGETADMAGHAVLLNQLPVMGTITDASGNTIETMTLETLSTSSDSDPGNYGYRTMQFQKVGDKWLLDGTGYEFKGYGQLNADFFKQPEPEETPTDDTQGN